MKEMKNVNIECICIDIDGKKRCIGLKDLAEVVSRPQHDENATGTCCGPNCC